MTPRAARRKTRRVAPHTLNVGMALVAGGVTTVVVHVPGSSWTEP
jgi:hypothetical protein